MESRSRTTSEAADALLEVLASIDHAQRGCLSHPERLHLLERFGRIQRMLDGLKATLVAEADAENSARHVTGAPLNSFLARTQKLTASQATSQVFSARDLVATPAVHEAVMNGDIDGAQARGIRSAMTDLPAPLTAHQRGAVEAELLTRAATTPAHVLARQGLDALKAACPEALDQQSEADLLEARARRAHRARSLRFLPERDGSVEFTGSLPVVDATRFQQLIGCRVESQRRTGTGTDPHSQTLMPQQRQADALLSILNDADPNHAAAPTAGRVHRERARIVVTIQEADLRARAVSAGVLSHSTTISASELRRLACDAELIPVVLGSRSEILDVGRASRLVTPGIRRALSIRDKGCIFPGCEAADHRCQAHHVVPFHQGGATSLANMVLLCPYHHALVEPAPPDPRSASPDRWRIEFDSGGKPHVLSADTAPSTRPPPGRHESGRP